MVAVDPNDAEDSTAFSRWYDDVQIPGLLRLSGTQRAIRYKASAVPASPTAPARQQYLVIYELEFPVAEGLADFAERQHQATLEKKIGRNSPGGSALKIQTAAGAYYEQVSPRVGSSDSPESVVLVYSDPIAGARDDEFIHWYSHTHLPYAVRVLGFPSAAQYRITQLNKDRMPSRWVVTNRYLTIYGVQAKGESALEAAAAALHATLDSSAGALVDLGGIRIQAYERISEPRASSDQR